jgi:26S proteasome regulatory subunit N2
VVASKVFFHLEEYEDALRLGLGAGAFFDVNNKSEYVETLVAKAIDEYIKLREQAETNKEAPPTIDPRLEAIVERMFARYDHISPPPPIYTYAAGGHPGAELCCVLTHGRCFQDGAYNQAVGIALEAHRLDKVRQNRALWPH